MICSPPEMFGYLRFFSIIGTSSDNTSTWKRTSANGLLTEDPKLSIGNELNNKASIDAVATSNADRTRNENSIKGPQFSTFFRVIS